MKDIYKLFPCVVVTTKVEYLSNTNGKWWEKNFYLPPQCRPLFNGCSRVQLYLLDQSLYLAYEKFVRVKTKIAQAVSSEQDLKNAPIIIIVDKELISSYKEHTSNDFIESELANIFMDLSPEKLEAKDEDFFNAYCVFKPDPVFPENIGEVIFSDPCFSVN